MKISKDGTTNKREIRRKWKKIKKERKKDK